MPTKVKLRKTASGSRKGTDGRKNRSGNRRATGTESKPSDPKILAASVHSLKLSAIPGARFIEQRSSVSKNLVRDLQQCLAQISARYIRVPPMAFADQVAWLTDELKKAARRFDIAIHEDEKTGRFQVHVFETCPYPDYMPIMVVGEALVKLCKYPKEKALFMDFLHLFVSTIHIDTWYWGTMDQARDEMMARLEFEEGNYDADDYQAMVDCMDFYKRKGGPDDHAKRLAKKCTIQLPQLIRRISRCRIPQLKVLMLEGCELLKPGLSIGRFDYIPSDEDYYEDGLRFWNQSAIVWRKGDHLGSVFDDLIDMYIQSGGQLDAYVFEIVRPDKRKALDMEEMAARRKWPQQLACFLERGNDLLDQFVNNHLLINNIFTDAECDTRVNALIEA